jgi:hypothetical protein
MTLENWHIQVQLYEPRLNGVILACQVGWTHVTETLMYIGYSHDYKPKVFFSASFWGQKTMKYLQDYVTGRRLWSSFPWVKCNYRSIFIFIPMSLRLLAWDEEQGLNVTSMAFEIVHCPADMKDTNNRSHHHMERNVTKPSSCRPLNGLAVSNSLTLHKRENMEEVWDHDRESRFILININIYIFYVL